MHSPINDYLGYFQYIATANEAIKYSNKNGFFIMSAVEILISIALNL